MEEAQMGTLKKPPVGDQREKGPDVVAALRDWVGQDHRIAVTEPDTDRSSSASPTPDRTHPEEADSERPPQDLSAGGDPSANAHQDPYDFHIAPSIQELHEPDPYQAQFQDDVSNRGATNSHFPSDLEEHQAEHPQFRGPEPRPKAPRALSVTRRVARTFAYGFVTLAVAGVVVAFLSNDNLLRSGGSIQSPTPESRSVTAESQNAGSFTNQLNSVLQQQLALRQQLDRIANDLGSVQRNVQRLAARQDEMEQNLATLRTSEQNLRQEVTALSQAVAQAPSNHPRRHRRNH